MKTIALLLTSSQIKLAQRCYDSIKNQKDVPFKYDIGVVINTKSKTYEKECYEHFTKKNIQTFITKSNGYPGKGHNALLEVFKNSDYDYCIMIDGDDMFYPYAFSQFAKIYKQKPKTDVVHLMINDNITYKEKDHMFVQLYGNFKLYSSINHQENWWKIKKIGNPFKQHLKTCRTPSRILVLSKNATKYIRYCEECKLYDDYLAWLLMVEAQHENKLNTIALSDPTIYCYNAINDDSATHNFKQFDEEKQIFEKNTKQLTVLRNNWDYHKELPYLKLENTKFPLKDRVKFCNDNYVKFEFSDKVNKVNQAKQSHNYKDMIKYITKLLEYGSVDPNLYLELGVAYYKTDKLSNAINCFEKSLQLKKNVSCYKNLALIYKETNDYKNSLKYSNLYLKENSNDKNILTFKNSLKYDGLTFKPKNKKVLKNKKILAIYTGYSAPFNGKNYEEKTVYGSEISAVKLAEQLADEYKVFVFCPCDEELIHNNVQYLDFRKFNVFQDQYQIDIMIVSRFVHFFAQFENSAKKTYLWIHDSRTHEYWVQEKFPNYSITFFNNIIENLDGVICVSDWHKKYFIHCNNLDVKYHHKIFMIGNGIEEQNFKEKHEKIKNRFIYCSDPDRGLDNLLNMFPKIKEKIPDAILDIYFSKIEKKLLDKIKQQKDVTFHGKLTQKQLAIELQKSDVWLYPNTSHETYCCCAHEAMMAGCIVICRKYSGLITTVGKGGVLLSGNPVEQNWQNKAISTVTSILQNGELKNKFQQRAIIEAKNKTWKMRAKSWLKLFNS